MLCCRRLHWRSPHPIIEDERMRLLHPIIDGRMRLPQDRRRRLPLSSRMGECDSVSEVENERRRLPNSIIKKLKIRLQSYHQRENAIAILSMIENGRMRLPFYHANCQRSCVFSVFALAFSSSPFSMVDRSGAIAFSRP